VDDCSYLCTISGPCTLGDLRPDFLCRREGARRVGALQSNAKDASDVIYYLIFALQLRVTINIAALPAST
jgi:hypothetical protein